MIDKRPYMDERGMIGAVFIGTPLCYIGDKPKRKPKINPLLMSIGILNAFEGKQGWK